MQALRKMLVAMRDAQEPDDGEAVRSGRSVWVDIERFSSSTLDQALRYMLVSDVSAGSTVERYIINSTGRAWLDNPGILDEIARAISAGGSWTVEGGHIVSL